jgi:hypothetical protein
MLDPERGYYINRAQGVANSTFSLYSSIQRIQAAHYPPADFIWPAGVSFHYQKHVLKLHLGKGGEEKRRKRWFH